MSPIPASTPESRPPFDGLALIRGRAPARPADIARALGGALSGLFAVGVAARMITGGGPSLNPLLIAPIGASAVLVFAIPASPLAQPRAVIAGNMISALVGLACVAVIPQPALAAAAASALAIAVMMMFGCLHPPGGAVALSIALAAASGARPGLGYVLVPTGLCSVLLVAAAVVYNNAVGRSYPHRAPAAQPPSARPGYARVDLDRALAHYGELLDVSREDLDALFREVEQQALDRLHSKVRCRDVMTLYPRVVDAQQSARSALLYLQTHGLHVAPVVDAQRRVVGLARREALAAGGHRLVEAVLDPFVHKVRPDASIETLLPLLSQGSAGEVMVVDDKRVLLGLITQTDLLAALYRAHIVESVAARPAS